jgi:hypothetical protein
MCGIFLATMLSSKLFFASVILLTAVRPGLAAPAAQEHLRTSPERHATIFYSAETHGVLEPCGCTSDPLGDFARASGLVRATAGRKKNVLLVDAGGLSYAGTGLAPRQRPAAKLRAEFLAREIARLPFGGAALGDTDLAAGVGEVKPRRLAVNLQEASFVEPSRMVQIGGIKIAVLGVADPAVARRAGLEAREPGPAAQAEVVRLRQAGAEIVILLAPVERPAARNLARTSGADFVVVGKNVGKGMDRAEPVGTAFVVAPGDELQYLGRLDIVLRGNGPRAADARLVDAGSAAQTKQRLAELARTLARLDADLARWRKDASADPSFVAGKAREREELRAEQARLTGASWRPPAAGSYFTNLLVPIRRTLARDPALASSLRKLDRAVGAANLAVAEPPPPPVPGRAFFVGGAQCVSCHKAAARAWKRTRHAHAWRTLVKIGKEAQDECVSCHVTGYGEVGGSSLGHTRGLEDVQCESCHQPNSIHVEKKGKESPYAGSLGTPEPVCVRCHNEKHSDTFQYEAYLRDALGPGHGETLLDKLGPGPTARELRRAATTKPR